MCRCRLVELMSFVVMLAVLLLIVLRLAAQQLAVLLLPARLQADSRLAVLPRHLLLHSLLLKKYRASD